MDAIKKFKKYLNEQEIPDFNDFEKNILQYAVDYIENVEEGDYGDDVASSIFNTNTIIDTYFEGIKLLEAYNGDNGSGWANGLEYLFDKGDDMGMDPDNIGSMIKDGGWNAVGNLLLLLKGEELLQQSEVISRVIRSNETMTASDIEDLEDELKLFIDN